MSILVTGASGQLGRLVVHALLERGVRPASIVATARDTAAVGDLATLGVVVRRADYDEPESMDAALAGVDKALLVSSNAIGERVTQHRNVIDAAVRAGVSLLAYTSILRADTSDLVLAADHRDTEEYLRTSGVPHVLLRNGWYLENHTDQIQNAIDHGAILGAAGNGLVSGATRADYAEAAAAVLTGADHAGRVYELGGDAAFTLADFAAELSIQTGTAVAYRDLPEEDFAAALTEAGLPQGFANVLADADHGIRDGLLFADTGELSQLIGRPTTSMPDAVKSALA